MTDLGGLLIVTNGEAAVVGLTAALPGADVLPWRDMLHDGPVPEDLPLAALSALRAAWLADHLDLDPAEAAARFRERDARVATVPPGTEVVLCFEHDLYDQLQLIQALAELAPRVGEIRLTLAQADDYLATQTPERLAALVSRRRPVGQGALGAAREAWAAFRARTPERLAALLDQPGPDLPCLAPALLRLLQELPDAAGLTRTERAALELLASDEHDPDSLFAAVGTREEARWLGDWPFFRRLEGLATPPSPLLAGLPGPYPTLGEPSVRGAWRRSRLSLTGAGRAVLAGERDRLRDRPPDRWLGGTHLRPGNLWRWDTRARRLAGG